LAAEARIPSFQLYGEARGTPFPDVLHCESIPARASLHDWTIAPHRHHNLHQFFWIESDGGEATLEGVTHPLAPAAAISLPAMSVHGFRFRPGTEGWVVTLPAATLDRQLAEAPALRAALGAGALLHPAASPPVEKPAWIFRAVAAEYAGGGPGRAQALAGLAGVLAVWFARALTGRAAGAGDADVPGAQAGAALLARFQAMVEQDYRSARPLAAYARALGVTPTHLSRVARTLTGRPASPGRRASRRAPSARG
jgi:AraC family transcriptional regulator, transcriptional activator of pobA